MRYSTSVTRSLGALLSLAVLALSVSPAPAAAATPAPTWYGVDLGPTPASPAQALNASVSGEATGPCITYASYWWTQTRTHDALYGYYQCAAQQVVSVPQSTYSVPTADVSVPVNCAFNWDPWVRTYNLVGYDTYGDTLHCMTHVEQLAVCPAGQAPQDPSGKCWVDLPHAATLEMTASCREIVGIVDARTGCADGRYAGRISHSGTLQIHLSQPKNTLRIRSQLDLTTDSFWEPSTSLDRNGLRGTNRRDHGPEVISPAFSVNVQPSLLLTLDYLPYKVIYAPPGDQSYGRFDELAMTSDSVTFTLGTSNAHAVTTDTAREVSVSAGVGFIGDLFKDVHTQSWEHSEQTALTTNTQNTQSLTVSKQFGQSWQTTPNSLLDQPGVQPWVNDLVLLLQKPRVVVWNFGPDPTAYALVGEEGTPRAVSAGDLVKCANSSGETDPNNPLALRPQECSSFASLDPFAAVASQNSGKIDADALGSANCATDPSSPLAQLMSAGQLTCYGKQVLGHTVYQAANDPGVQAGTPPYTLSWQQTTQSAQTQANGGKSVSEVTDIATNKNVLSASLSVGDSLKLDLGNTTRITNATTNRFTLEVDYQTSNQIAASLQTTGTVQYSDRIDPILAQQWLDRRFGTFLAAVPAPSIHSLSTHQSASMTGGELLTINGAGFMSGAIAVKVCAVNATCADGTNIRVFQDGMLSVKIPAAPLGTFGTTRSGSQYATTVYVVGAGGWSVAHGDTTLSYATGNPDIPTPLPGGGVTVQLAAPTVQAISAGLTSGKAMSGDVLTLSGQYFHNVPGLSFQFCKAGRTGCVSAAPLSVISDTSATVTVPDGLVAGDMYIWANNAGGLSTTSLKFTYSAPLPRPIPCTVRTCS